VSDFPGIPIGERVRFYRERQYKTQTVVAGLAGISPDYLSQIERGLKTPTVAVLGRLAGILGVRTSALLGEPPFESGPSEHPVIAALQDALLRGDATPEAPGGPDVRELGRRVAAAWGTWHTSPARVTDVAALLPPLLWEAAGAVRSLRAPQDAERRRAATRHQAAVDLLVREYCRCVGRQDLSLLAADRAVRLAEEADDPLRMLAGRWHLTHALIGGGQPRTAGSVAIEAASELSPRLADLPVGLVGMYGLLHLAAARAAVRSGDPWSARAWVREAARRAAGVTGDGFTLWAVGGPTNVDIHAAVIEIEDGRAAEALRLARQVDLTRAVTGERRAALFLVLARCHDQRRDDAGVLLNLQRAVREAPEDLRHNLLARDMVRGLLKRAGRTDAPDVRTLAERLQLFA
jgi:transcriptional regulator with XRE-family HTH domain